MIVISMVLVIVAAVALLVGVFVGGEANIAYVYGSIAACFGAFLFLILGVRQNRPSRKPLAEGPPEPIATEDRDVPRGQAPPATDAGWDPAPPQMSPPAASFDTEDDRAWRPPGAPAPSPSGGYLDDEDDDDVEVMVGGRHEDAGEYEYPADYGGGYDDAAAHDDEVAPRGEESYGAFRPEGEEHSHEEPYHEGYGEPQWREAPTWGAPSSGDRGAAPGPTGSRGAASMGTRTVPGRGGQPDRYAEDLRRAERVLGDVQGVGPAKRAALMDYFGSYDALLGASVNDIAALSGISPTLAERIRARLDREA